MTDEYEARLTALTNSLARAEQRERERIAQVLHDDLQQLLYSAQMHLGLLHESMPDGNSHLDEVEQMLHEAVAVTRSLTIDLSPHEVEDTDFSRALRWLANQMQEMHGLDVEIVGNGPVEVPNRDVRVLLLRSLRELLFNVVKHADTRQASIVVNDTDGWTKVVVSDDGSGFSFEEVGDVFASSRGLAHVRHRLDVIGGDLTLTSQPGDGTRITLRWPSGLDPTIEADELA